MAAIWLKQHIHSFLRRDTWHEVPCRNYRPTKRNVENRNVFLAIETCLRPVDYFIYLLEKLFEKKNTKRRKCVVKGRLYFYIHLSVVRYLFKNTPIRKEKVLFLYMNMKYKCDMTFTHHYTNALLTLLRWFYWRFFLLFSYFYWVKFDISNHNRFQRIVISVQHFYCCSHEMHHTLGKLIYPMKANARAINRILCWSENILIFSSISLNRYAHDICINMYRFSSRNGTFDQIQSSHFKKAHNFHFDVHTEYRCKLWKSWKMRFRIVCVRVSY